LETEVVDRLTQTTLEHTNDPDLLLSQEMRDVEVEQPAGEPQLIAVARLLWPKRVFLAKATFAGLVIALVLAFVLPKMYEANVQLMPPDASALSGSSAMMGMALNALSGGAMGGGSASSAGGFAGAVGDILGVQKPGALFIGILSSRTLSDRLIDRFDLRKVYGIKTYLRTRKKLLSRVTFREDKKSGLISIIVSDRDPVRATAMAQAYVDELNALLSHVNNSAASRERQFLEGRLTTVHAELESAAKDLSVFSSRNATLDPQDQGKAMLDAAAALEGQLIAAKSELSGLEQIYTNENVRVRSLRAHISELEQQINDLGGKGYAGSTKLDSNALYPSIRQLPVLGQQYLELYRNAKIDETVFELLTEAYEMAKVEEAKDTPSVKVLDAARLPERPSWPPLQLFVVGGAFLGFCFATTCIVGAERWPENEPHRLFLAEISRTVRDDWTEVRARLSRLTSRRRDSSD
jgi:uncharacterized protein involved in exopolysaccharide biosynthesis